MREGLAWAFVRYSADYVDQEAKAKADRLQSRNASTQVAVGVLQNQILRPLRTQTGVDVATWKSGIGGECADREAPDLTSG